MNASKTLNLKEPRIFLIILTILTIAVFLFYFITSMITSVGYQTFAEAEKEVSNGVNEQQYNAPTIILDAGHGGEDPGAVVNGLNEKDLNLAITEKLKKFLELSGYRVILTRTDDRLLYNTGEEKQKKYYDLYNRLKIAEAYPDAIFISIHMNKFPLESCKGLQTFYSVNNHNSSMLADALQQASKLLMPDNSRTIKPDQDLIFLLKKLEIPAVLVECGFLSNRDDADHLSEPNYQDQLSFTLYCGIVSFIKEYKVENKLRLQ